MKNLVIDKKIDKIHISEITPDNVIEVVAAGLRVGFIYYYYQYWRFFEFNSDIEYNPCSTLTLLIERIEGYYRRNEVEFRVFE